VILGIWDGHDSGAALLDGNRVLFAVNEERLTRRKLEVGFPKQSIRACLDHAEISNGDLEEIAISTWDPAKTLTRLFPGLKEKYYLLRRRKTEPPRWSGKLLKYPITEFTPNGISRRLSERVVRAELRKLGFRKVRLSLVNHHEAHAAAAAFFSPFPECLVVTLDGIGDGLSGTIYTKSDGGLHPVQRVSGRNSLGIFFEHVTNLLNMRELEDEGKVMALADYAYPVPDRENPLLPFFTVDGLSLRARYGSLRMYRELAKVLWRYPSEQFAHMAQKTLETHALKWVQNAIRITGRRRVALAGGVVSNIKLNRLIRELPETEDLFVFPHMGDGGLALGAAAARNHVLHGVTAYPCTDLFWGPSFSEGEMEQTLIENGVSYSKPDSPEMKAAELIAEGNIVFWFQGRMEYGPRALGDRSILARPDRADLRDELNLRLKQRVWYQPFCPSLLEEEGGDLFEDYRPPGNPHMTVAYMVKKERRGEMSAVIGRDGSCRPQFVSDTATPFGRLLVRVKERTGRGVVLNTSFNIHGKPMVNAPLEALTTFQEAGGDHLFLGPFWVLNR
jgi:carbamoyltransferase